HKKAMFVISNKNIQNEYAMYRGNMMKNNNRREDKFVDIRYVKGKLIKDDSDGKNVEDDIEAIDHCDEAEVDKNDIIAF
ncbi:4810_t:CDS:1, partial [Dentiscutata erythropus]